VSDLVRTSAQAPFTGPDGKGKAQRIKGTIEADRQAQAVARFLFRLQLEFEFVRGIER
jgi:hypothetical protein